MTVRDAASTAAQNDGLSRRKAQDIFVLGSKMNREEHCKVVVHLDDLDSVLLNAAMLFLTTQCAPYVARDSYTAPPSVDISHEGCA